MAQWGTSNRGEWRGAISEAWEKLKQLDATAAGSTSSKQTEAARLEAQDLVNNLQDWLVGSTTSQDVLRAIYLRMTDAQRAEFEKMWRRVLNPNDHDVEDFKARCFPGSLEITVRDQKRAIAERDELIATLKANVETVTSEYNAAQAIIRERDATIASQTARVEELQSERDHVTKEYNGLQGLPHLASLHRRRALARRLGSRDTNIHRLRKDQASMSKHTITLQSLPPAEFEVSPSQHEALTSTRQDVCFIGPAGSGRTWCGILWSFLQAFSLPGGSHGLMVAPTWPIFKQTIMYDIRHLAPRLGLSRPGSDELLDFDEVDHTLTLYNGSTIVFRSVDRSDDLRGLSVDWLFADEIGSWSGAARAKVFSCLIEGGRSFTSGSGDDADIITNLLGPDVHYVTSLASNPYLSGRENIVKLIEAALLKDCSENELEQSLPGDRISLLKIVGACQEVSLAAFLKYRATEQ